MERQNIKIALRNFRKNKNISAINILGLAVGISTALVILLIIQYDYSFDKWEPRRNDTYQVITETGNNQAIAAVPIPAPAAIKASIPEIETLAYYIPDPFYAPHISIPDQSTNDAKIHQNIKGVAFTDQQYFSIIPHKWIAGNARTLNQLNNVVLTRSEANKFFPGITPANIIGQTIRIQDSIPFKVTGIVADLKQRTDFDATIFLSLPTLMKTPLLGSVLMEPAWYNLNGISKCLVQLRPGASREKINLKLAKLFKSHPFNIGDTKQYSARLQPMSDIHFNMDLDGKVSKSTLLQLGLLASVLILLAIINYVNISTAMATTRAKEIGVRKTFGGSKHQIFRQFLTETCLLTCLAAILAVFLVPFILHAFRDFIPDGLKLETIITPVFLLFIISLIVIVSYFAGFYPAYILTKWQPAHILKSQPTFNGAPNSGKLRQILTTGQFIVAQIFLIIVVLMGKQIKYLVNHEMGFKKEAIVNFSIPNTPSGSSSLKYSFVQQLNTISGISQVSVASAPPIRRGYSETEVSWMRNGKKESFNQTQLRSIDEKYLDIYGIYVLAGRNIRKDSTSKTPDVLINESMMQQMGYSEPGEAIGTFLKGYYADRAEIVGVVKNFNTQSLHYKITPTVLFADNVNRGSVISVMLSGDPSTWSETLKKITLVFKKFYPNDLFESSFFDDAIAQLYQSDIRVAKLLNWATAIAIFISLLGLLGLVSFMANRRIKEISIRKVLGASTLQIILLLSKGLLKLVIIATIIALPIAWYFAGKWLQDFAYKTVISWWVFAISTISMLTIALIILWLRTIKTARINPATSLKTE